MNIKDLLQDDALKALEDQIILSFEGCWSKDHDYTDERSLIEVRKTIINHRVLQYQDLLLPDIIAFNDTMREALREMFDKPTLCMKLIKKLTKMWRYGPAATSAMTIRHYTPCKVRTVKSFGMLCRIQDGTCCTTPVCSFRSD